MAIQPPKSARLLGFVPPASGVSPGVLVESASCGKLEEKSAVLPKVLPKVAPETSTLAPEPAARAREVLVVRGAEELSPWLSAWQDLADGAVEPNVFYEPWMLIPALETLAPTPAPEFHLIFAPGRGPTSAKPQLCGLFPLVRSRRYKSLRAQALRLWRHLYCPLCTPLLRRGEETETLGALLDFLRVQPRGASLLEMSHVSADGPIGRALVEVFSERDTTTFVDETWSRAVLRLQASKSGEDYLKSAVSGKHRKEFRRKETRLAGEGAVRYTELNDEPDPGAALESYIADFLRIEASGWKGESGNAFACDPHHQEFFRAIVTGAHRRGRLILTMLRVGEQTIAAKCDFRAGTGAFAFKIGFDERYARFSPGVLLELAGIHQMHDLDNLRWVDSCAMPNHPMINRLWRERRTLQTVVVATGRGRGEFLVAAMSLVRHFKRAARRKSPPATGSNPKTLNSFRSES